MYRVVYTKAKGHLSHYFTTEVLNVESIQRMCYWYYKVQVYKDGKLILDSTDFED